VKTFVLLLAAVSLVSCAAPFPYDDYGYAVTDLELGIAFPGVSSPEALQKTIAALTDFSQSYVRIGEHWSLRETADDVFSWGPLETRLDAFSAAGIKVLLSIESHEWPAWLSSTGAHSETATLDQFRYFVRELLRLYGDRIEYIQFGNEWNWEIDTYFAGDENAFIDYTNILGEEVTSWRNSVSGSTPVHVLGSFAGGNQLAYDQGLLSSIVIDGTPVYTEKVSAYGALPQSERVTVRTRHVLQDAAFEMLDIHLYDNVQDWDKSVSAYQQALADVGKSSLPLIVSEFGGPWATDLYPEFGKPSPNILADRLVSYVHTLDGLPVSVAFFFKLNESSEPEYHNDSFLIDRWGSHMPAYGVLTRFGDYQ